MAIRQRWGFVKREIPWVNVVRFHKEIASRSEQSLFSINGEKSDSKTWTSLEDFFPGVADISGPWKVREENFTSLKFLDELDHRNHETCFIGGPCFLTIQRDKKTESKTLKWNPILYRQVTYLRSEDFIEINPAESKWNINPVIFQQLRNLDVGLHAEQGEIAVKVLEEASRLCEKDSNTFSECVTRVLSNEFEELSEYIRKKWPDSKDIEPPSKWIMFAAPKKFGAFNRNLMGDYENLEKKITLQPELLGGLKIFEGENHQVEIRTKEVLNVVPLNDNQKCALDRSMGGDPLTVISGPPGCGKSQVVVSLLLNAWANGESVLFASNNNKAVDVVRERLEKFEAEFPIAIRAGSRKFSNINEVLLQTIDFPTKRYKSKNLLSDEDLHSKEEELSELRQLLESKKPQKINEAITSALRSYQRYIDAKNQLESASTRFNKNLNDLRIGLKWNRNESIDQLEKMIKKTEVWFSNRAKFEKLSEDDLQCKNSTRRAVEECEAVLLNQSMELGYKAHEDETWTWLSSANFIERFTDWLARWNELLQSGIENQLKNDEWLPEFDRFEDHDKALNCSRLSKKLARDITHRLPEFLRKKEILDQAKSDCQSAKDSLHDHGLEETSNVDLDIVIQWQRAYADLVTQKSSHSDILPWSAPKKLDRQLSRIEKILKSYIPVSIIKSIGVLDQAGRDKLAPILEVLAVWKKAFDFLEVAEAEHQEIGNEFVLYREQARDLYLPLETYDYVESSWIDLAQNATDLGQIANKAAEAFLTKQNQYDSMSKLNEMLILWDQIGRGTPFKEAWSAGSGKEFVSSMDKLHRDPSREHFDCARKETYTGVLDKLLKNWSSSVDTVNEIENLNSKLNAIPDSNHRIDQWYSSKNEGVLPVFAGKPTAWFSDEVAQQKLMPYFDLVSEMKDYLEAGEALLNDTMSNEYGDAVKRFKEALDLLDNNVECVSLQKIYSDVKEAPNDSWPSSKINELIKKHTPSEINLKIDRISNQLENHAFQIAKDNWINRMESDTESRLAVDNLQSLLLRKNRVDTEEDFQVFKNALRLVPIWITTARSPQAIPLEADLFDLVIIDEASQCTLTELLPLLYRGKRLVIIGDSDQLPAIDIVEQSEEEALANKFDVLDHLSVIGHFKNDLYSASSRMLPLKRADVIQLTDHYRSHPLIIGFSNRYIYQQRLKMKSMLSHQDQKTMPTGLFTVPVNGVVERNRNSWVNIEEAKKVFELVKRQQEQSSTRGLSLGVVTPFRAQKEYIQGLVQSAGLSNEILVDTVHAFQGDERDAMIFSPVVGPGIADGGLRFVEEAPNLINVALTRARMILCVVANHQFLLHRSKGLLKNLGDYCQDVKKIRDSKSPSELDLFSWMLSYGLSPSVHPVIGDQEVDFLLKSSNGSLLAIEVDGERFHKDRTMADKSRQVSLDLAGCACLRIKAREVAETPSFVMEEILKKLDELDSKA